MIPAQKSLKMPGEGVEPSWYCYRQILSLVRLPFRHPGVWIGPYITAEKSRSINNCRSALFRCRYSTIHLFPAIHPTME